MYMCYIWIFIFQYLEEESKLLQYALQKYKRELQAMETTFQVNSELADKELTEEERSVVTLVTIYKRQGILKFYCVVDYCWENWF